MLSPDASEVFCLFLLTSIPIAANAANRVISHASKSFYHLSTLSNFYLLKFLNNLSLLTITTNTQICYPSIFTLSIPFLLCYPSILYLLIPFLSVLSSI